MITVCVPIYNFNITALAAELTRQSVLLAGKIEIIFIDDGSCEKFRSVNREICSKETYIESAQNLGRSKIRNLFTKHARFSYLLFLDCDSEIISVNFLRNYLEQIHETAKVICGGTVYSDSTPPRNQMLRWKYGKDAEAKPVLIRQKNPANFFNANNFLVHRSILLNNPFNELLQDYGHEDTLFAYELKQKNIPIRHIDNPVLHAGLDTNVVFLQKTERAVLNLLEIKRIKGGKKSFIEYVRLLRAQRWLQTNHLSGAFAIFFSMVQPIIKNLLMRGVGISSLFAFYKLGILVMNEGKFKELDR